MSLEFVGSRFREDQLKVGCSLYVTINLGSSVIAAVVSVITCERVKSNKQVKWLVGAAITQTSDADSTKLAAYLEKLSKIELVVALA
jgi:hypothetical protein